MVKYGDVMLIYGVFMQFHLDSDGWFRGWSWDSPGLMKGESQLSAFV